MKLTPQIPKLICLLTITSLTSLNASGQAVPPLVNYQGRLTDQAGAPLAGGSYTIQFRLWDDATATGANDLIWNQQQTVGVQSNGVFNVILGSPGGSVIQGSTPQVNNLAFAFTATNRFLGLTVVSNGFGPIVNASEILPRQQLLTVPFAFQAQQAQIASNLITNLANALCPAGSVMAFAGANVPNGWLLCDGSVMSSSQYPLLYAAISTNWGMGNSAVSGTNDFNLPDLRGMFLRGVNGSRTNNGTLNNANTSLTMDPDVSTRTNGEFGGNSGNLVGSLQGFQLQSHNHAWGSFYNSGWQGGLVAGYIHRDDSADNTFLPTTRSGGAETRPENAYVNYIIKY